MESRETTSYLTRPRQSNEELITSRADRPHLGSQLKGQASEMMGAVAMGTQTAAGPPGATGEPGSSPEKRLKWFETALLSPGTLLTALSCRLPMFFWE